jgi:coenzyme F420-0:L-glutamate ligase/coenzyme F420-1:gamma-L-glutamate ligase
MMPGALTVSPLPGIPMIQPGDDIAGIVSQALDRAAIRLQDQDVLVVAQKIVSKSEGRHIRLRDVSPSERALTLAQHTGKNPRLVEVILSESREVIAHKKGVLITAHRNGEIVANAGVDQSNVAPDDDGDLALRLPESSQRSAERCKQALDARYGVAVGVIINDSFGRPWRNGVVSVALGAAGLPALRSLIGRPDLFGRQMQVTESAFADQIATAAALVMGEADEGIPAVHVRGLAWQEAPRPARDLVRSSDEDMFR